MRLISAAIVLMLLVILGCKSKQPKEKPALPVSSKRMADGKQWLTQNLYSKTDMVYCQQNDEKFCAKYGGLYTWRTAKRACQALGNGWRLPTDEEWKGLAKSYGGIVDDSHDQGKAAFVHLIEGGDSGFNAVPGGNREPDGTYQRMEDHGFYWTSSEYDSTDAWFYNFAKGATLLNHHTGNKNRAISVRCIHEPSDSSN